MATTLSVKRIGDVVELVGPWENTLLVSDEFLTDCDPRYVSVGDGLLTFRLNNERTTYGLVREVGQASMSVYRLLNIEADED